MTFSELLGEEKPTKTAAKKALKKLIAMRVKEDRVKWKKLHGLIPSRHQAPLLEDLKKRGDVSFDESLGFNWTLLGGLLARGLLTWDRGRLRVTDGKRSR